MWPFSHTLFCRYISSLPLINTRWRSNTAWCTSFLHCRQEELITTNTLAPFYCPLSWGHLLLRLDFVPEIVTNILPFTLNVITWKQKTKYHSLILSLLKVPCKWQQIPFIALWIPAWSHNHSRNCMGNARSNMGRSASCVCHRKARTTGYD
jgi:hypothetical protein